MPGSTMPDVDDDREGRMPCRRSNCHGVVEASARIWFDLDDRGRWSIYGVCDEAATICCNEHEHDNDTPQRSRSLAAYIESLLPGSTWAGSDPRRRLTA